MAAVVFDEHPDALVGLELFRQFEVAAAAGGAFDGCSRCVHFSTPANEGMPTGEHRRTGFAGLLVLPLEGRSAATGVVAFMTFPSSTGRLPAWGVG
ncbi:hypothetical protein D9M70_648800 [compost metagenome]